MIELTRVESAALSVCSDCVTVEQLTEFNKAQAAAIIGGLKRKGVIDKTGSIVPGIETKISNTRQIARMAQAKAAAEKYAMIVFDNSEDVGQFQVTIRAPKNKNIVGLHTCEFSWPENDDRTKGEFWFEVIEHINYAAQGIKTCNGYTCENWCDMSCGYWHGRKPTESNQIESIACNLVPDASKLSTDQAYFEKLISDCDLTAVELSRRIGITYRALTTYRAKSNPKPWPYLIQFSIESLAYVKRSKRAGIELPPGVIDAITPDSRKRRNEPAYISELVERIKLKPVDISRAIDKQAQSIRLWINGNNCPYPAQFALECLANSKS